MSHRKRAPEREEGAGGEDGTPLALFSKLLEREVHLMLCTVKKTLKQLALFRPRMPLTRPRHMACSNAHKAIFTDQWYMTGI
jgi:hypothetical protein